MNTFETKAKVSKLISYAAREACHSSAHRDREGRYVPSVPSSQAWLREEGAMEKCLVKPNVYYKSMEHAPFSF